MAKRLGEPMSGSIANLVYSRNKGGQYIRNKGIPTNPNAIKQQAMRAILATLSAAWAGLSSANQTLWANWATLNPVIDRLGQSMVISGQNAYIQLNSRLLQSGSTASATPPVTTGPSQLLTLSAAQVSPAALTVTFTTTPLPAGSKLAVWGTLPSTKGRNPNRNQARLIGYGGTATASPLVLSNPYPSLAAQLINLYVSVMDANGRLSPGQKVAVITT